MRLAPLTELVDSEENDIIVPELRRLKQGASNEP